MAKSKRRKAKRTPTPKRLPPNVQPFWPGERCSGSSRRPRYTVTTIIPFAFPVSR